MKLSAAVYLLFLISCTSGCRFSSDENKTEHSGITVVAADSARSPATSETFKTDSVRIYTHNYDTSYRDTYALQPDSLYKIWSRFKTTDKNETDVYKQLAYAPQGKCFLKKMKMIYSYSKLKNVLQLPENAYILETKKIAGKNNTDRILVLWMTDPYILIDGESSYTCPEYTMGKAYFEGKTFLSVVSADKNTMINTIQIKNDYTVTDTVGNTIVHKTYAGTIVPVSARKRQRSRGAMSGKYFTTHATDTTDGAVEILHLEDFNQDGKAHEFAVFENFGCAGTSCTLYGYSIMQDKVIHYTFKTTYQADVWRDTIKVLNKDTMYTETVYWADALFTLTPKPFPIKFAIDFRGRGGEYNYYYFNYDKKRELFTQTIDSRSKEEDADIPTSWIPSIH